MAVEQGSNLGRHRLALILEETGIESSYGPLIVIAGPLE